jgi:hypothetical protein
MSRKVVLSAVMVAVFGLRPVPAFADTGSALTPGALAIYYGMPSQVNGSQTLSAAANVFEQYDAVVFGDSLEFPQYTGAPGQVPYYGCNQNSNFDHNNTVAIISNLNGSGTAVYGYVSIGGEGTARLCGSPPTPTPLTMDQIKARIDAWAAMGVAGIFLDEAEYGFGSFRQRQTDAIDYVHSQGLSAFINSYNPGDVFSNAVVGQVTLSTGALSTVAMNPNGLGTHLGPNDLYLLEHFQIIDGNYRTEAADAAEWARADQASAYYDQYGTLVATIPTSGPAFDQGEFNYAWWSTLLYGFDFCGWGEQYYSALNNDMPYRVRPNPGRIGNAYTSDVTVPPAFPYLHERNTTCGLITVNSSSHLGYFTPTTTLRHCSPQHISQE